MKTQYMQVLALCGALAVPALSLAGGVKAGYADAQADAVTVSYKDLDLNTQAGAQRLYKRIAVAAAQVCPDVSSAELERYMRSLECRQQVIALAVERVHSPRLTAIHAARTGHAPTSTVAWLQPVRPASSLARVQ